MVYLVGDEIIQFSAVTMRIEVALGTQWTQASIYHAQCAACERSLSTGLWEHLIRSSTCTVLLNYLLCDVRISFGVHHATRHISTDLITKLTRTTRKGYTIQRQTVQIKLQRGTQFCLEWL